MFRTYPKPKALWHWEEIALILFCLTLPMQNLGIITGGFTFAKIFLMVGYPYFMVRAYLRRDMWTVLVQFRSWIMIGMWALLLANLLSGVNALNMDMWMGFNARYLQLNNAIVFMVMVIKKEKRVLYALMIALLVGSIPNCLAGTYELITGKMVLKYVAQGTEETVAVGGGTTELPGSEGSRRIIGFDGGPGDHAMHFVVYAALSAVIPFLVKNWLLRGASLILLFLNMVNVAGTGSRTGMIGLAIAVAAFIVLVEMRHKWLLVTFLAASTLFAVYVFDLPIPRLLGKKGEAHMTTTFRVQQYRTAFNMFLRHKFFGIGAGQFHLEYNRYQWNFPGYERKMAVLPLHNSYLNQLAEGGILGLFFLLLFLFVVMYQLYIMRVRSGNPLHRLLAVGIFSGFVGWCGGLLFYPAFLDEQGWILMAFTMGLWNIHELERKSRTS